jgi:iron complex transport system permease protein
MAATAGRVEPAPGVEARGVGLRAGFLTAVFLVAALAVGLAVGSVHVGIGTILRSALSYVPFLHVHQASVFDRDVLWQLRAPRVALAALVGGMLAVAGASYQGVFRNPLCDPYLLGVAGGAGLGATLAIIYASAAATGSNWAVPLAAFAGAIGAVVVTYALGRSAGAVHTTGALVLAGVTMATFTAAVQTFVQQQHTQQLQNVYAWLLGGFSTATWRDVAICAPYVAASSLVLVLHRRILDVLSLGDDEAASGSSSRIRSGCSSRPATGPSCRSRSSPARASSSSRTWSRARYSRRPSCRSASSLPSSARRSSPSSCERPVRPDDRDA